MAGHIVHCLYKDFFTPTFAAHFVGLRGVPCIEHARTPYSAIYPPNTESSCASCTCLCRSSKEWDCQCVAFILSQFHGDLMDFPCLADDHRWKAWLLETAATRRNTASVAPFIRLRLHARSCTSIPDDGHERTTLYCQLLLLIGLRRD